MLNKKAISIPYGAIKSDIKNETKKQIEDISIPYGAIKRFRKLMIILLIKAFQFLMVRLKDVRL